MRDVIGNSSRKPVVPLNRRTPGGTVSVRTKIRATVTAVLSSSLLVLAAEAASAGRSWG